MYDFMLNHTFDVIIRGILSYYSERSITNDPKPLHLRIYIETYKDHNTILLEL